MEFEQGDVLLCSVDKIVGTTVFVNIDGTTKTGSMVFSEVAPGRIRNIRDYIVPKKTIVCKILKITPNNIELSLRRVKEKERKEIIEQHKIEKSYRAILKSILKEKTKEIVEKIKQKNSLYNFLENSKENSKELEELVGKENSKSILEILKTQKKKTIILKKEMNLSTTDPNGLSLIKEILTKIEGVEIKYIAAGKYSLKREDTDIKKADTFLSEKIQEIEKAITPHNFQIKYKQ
jgi:translation initiation factor 2 alpha subunit (eIF-2alpha)